jgi:hypothetical protein
MIHAAGAYAPIDASSNVRNTTPPNKEVWVSPHSSRQPSQLSGLQLLPWHLRPVRAHRVTTRLPPATACTDQYVMCPRNRQVPPSNALMAAGRSANTPTRITPAMGITSRTSCCMGSMAQRNRSLPRTAAIDNPALNHPNIFRNLLHLMKLRNGRRSDRDLGISTHPLGITFQAQAR